MNRQLLTSAGLLLLVSLNPALSFASQEESPKASTEATSIKASGKASDKASDPADKSKSVKLSRNGKVNPLRSQTSSESASEQKNGNSNGDSIPAGLVLLPPESRYYSKYAFVVDKTARRLAVWEQTSSGMTQVADFPADLGKNNSDKRFTGDHATPEGIYFLQERLEGASLDFKLFGKRAFTTDYPNFFDRMDGKTGYGIWLHAVPDEVPLTRGSRGCVVVRNEAILGLSQYVTLGRTPILIQNKTDLISKQEVEKNSQALLQWLEKWRSSWETKDLDSYMTAYGEDFRSMRMNRDQWRDYKASLNEKYQSIQVRISRPTILADRNRAIVRFLQEYTSDQHSDFGEKVLWLKKDSNGEFRIVGESWSAEPSEVAREEIAATTQTTAATAPNPQGAGTASAP